MRLNKYLNEEDAIKKGLSVDEPEVGADYTEEEVTDHLLPVLAALDHLRKKGIKSDADEAIFRDLKDKKDKWQELQGGKEEGGDEEGGDEEGGDEEESDTGDKETDDIIKAAMAAS